MARLQDTVGERQGHPAHRLHRSGRLGRHLLTLCAAGLAAALEPAAVRGEVALLVEEGPEASAQALGVSEGDGLRLRRFSPGELSDPIVSGRLLSRLQASDGVVAVGNDAATWAARELEGVRVHFAGGLSRVPGASLTARGWTGSLPYAPGAYLDLARTEGWKRVGVLTVPAFAGLLAAVREAADARGVALSVRVARGRPDIPAAAQALSKDCDALWLLGDPSLTSGAGFDFLVELSLSRRVPLLASEPGLLAAGVYAAWEPDPKALAAGAAAFAKGVHGEGGWPAARVAFAPAAGRLRVNEVLRRRWAGRPGGPP